MVGCGAGPREPGGRSLPAVYAVQVLVAVLLATQLAAGEGAAQQNEQLVQAGSRAFQTSLSTLWRGSDDLRFKTTYAGGTVLDGFICSDLIDIGGYSSLAPFGCITETSGILDGAGIAGFGVCVCVCVCVWCACPCLSCASTRQTDPRLLRFFSAPSRCISASGREEEEGRVAVRGWCTQNTSIYGGEGHCIAPLLQGALMFFRTAPSSRAHAGPAPPPSADGPPPLPPLFLSLANVSGDHGKIGTPVPRPRFSFLTGKCAVPCIAP